MNAFLLKFALGKDVIAEIRKYKQFKKPYSQEGRKLSDAEQKELLAGIWPIFMDIFNIIELKERKIK